MQCLKLFPARLLFAIPSTLPCLCISLCMCVFCSSLSLLCAVVPRWATKHSGKCLVWYRALFGMEYYFSGCYDWIKHATLWSPNILLFQTFHTSIVWWDFPSSLVFCIPIRTQPPSHLSAADYTRLLHLHSTEIVHLHSCRSVILSLFDCTDTDENTIWAQ